LPAGVADAGKLEGVNASASRSPAAAFRKVWEPDWTKLDFRIGSRCATGIGIALLVGLLIGSPIMGAIAAAGALGTAFGAFERIRGSSAIPMLLATGGMGGSVFVGIVFGHSDLAYVLLAAISGGMCGALVGFGTGYWYVGLQWTIAGLVAAEFTGDAHTAAQHSALLVAGGLLETIVVLALRQFRPLVSPIAPPDALDPRDALRVIVRTPVVLHAVRRRLRFTRGVWVEAVRLAIALAVSAYAGRALHLSHAYWCPMTTLIVMKSDLHLTLSRGLARVCGTLLGVALTALITLALHPGPIVLCALSLLAAFLMFSLLKVNYAVYSICITTFVVFQLAFLNLPAPAAAMERGFATLLGFVIALLAHLVWNVQHLLRKGTPTTLPA
jgi:hypothetical protein